MQPTFMSLNNIPSILCLESWLFSYPNQFKETKSAVGSWSGLKIYIVLLSFGFSAKARDLLFAISQYDVMYVRSTASMTCLLLKAQTLWLNSLVLKTWQRSNIKGARHQREQIGPALEGLVQSTSNRIISN